MLVALAVILIPELLSGPSAKHKPAAAPTRNEQGIKTYQFDLNQPGAANGQFTSSTAAPPAEQAPVAQPNPEPSAPAETTTAAPPMETPAPVAPPAKPAAEPAPEPVAPTASSPLRALGANSPGWAVQLGSFADTERANHLVERLRAAGHNAYLVPLRRADGKTLQRVRIGPYEQRSAAETALQRVAGETKGAAIVSQP